VIARDQPTIFGKSVVVAVSSLADGDMSFGRQADEEVTWNRIHFLEKAGIQPDRTTLVRISYEDAEHFARYRTVVDSHRAEGMFAPKSGEIADAAVVTQPDHALFLPIADCVGVVLYDPIKRLLMVSHVGRHSAEIDGAEKSVEYLVDNFSINPQNLLVWLSPAIGKVQYPLHKKDGKSLHETIQEQLLKVGVLSDQIEVSAIDTAEDVNYFSHSQFLKGERDTDGRFAVVAQMTEQGEPAL